MVVTLTLQPTLELTDQVYRANHPVEVLTQPIELVAPEVLSGLVLNLAGILD